MPTPQLASIPGLPGYGFNQPPEIIGAITDTKTNPKGDQLVGEATQIRALTLTAAQLLALKGADITVAEAPGAGYALMLEEVSVRINFGTTAYTLNAGTLKLFLGPSANGLALTGDLSAILTQAATSDNVGIPGLASGVAVKANIENQPLVIGNTGAAQYTLGDGTLDVVVSYTVVQM
jgi:hypothetical protein